MKTLAKILLIEDNANDVEMTLAAFAECKLANEIVVVQDGQEALDYLLRNASYGDRVPGNPAVILLDLKLPKIDGIEVLRRIRAEPSLKCIPVVIMISSHGERDMVEEHQLGMNGYAIKPVDFPRLVESVKDLGISWAAINRPCINESV